MLKSSSRKIVSRCPYFRNGDSGSGVRIWGYRRHSVPLREAPELPPALDESRARPEAGGGGDKVKSWCGCRVCVRCLDTNRFLAARVHGCVR